MHPRLFVILIIVFVLAASLAGCRRATATPTPTTVAPAPTLAPPTPALDSSPLPTPTPSSANAFDGLAVALLTSGPVTDGGWNQAAFAGLQTLANQGATVANTENAAPGDQANLLRSYAEGGFDIIIGHGAEFGEALAEVAQEYPDIHFIQIGGAASNQGNLASFTFRSGEAAYAAGILAGLMMENGRLGGLGTVESPSSVADFTAFEQAAQHANPAVGDVPVAYAGNGAAEVSAAALNLFESGIELILAHDGVDQAAVSEAATEQGPTAFLIGWSYAPPPPPSASVLATVQQRVGQVLVAAVAAIRSGGMEWKAHTVGFGEGLQTLAPYASIVPVGVAAEVDAVIQALIDGKIVLDESGRVVTDEHHK